MGKREDSWLDDVPMRGRDVPGFPSAGQCHSGDCVVAQMCEEEQCLRAEYEARSTAEGGV